MKLAELMEGARKLRLRKAPLRFRPQLIYLVDTIGGYVHPSQSHLTSGQTAWTDSNLWFQCHKDARDFAELQPAWHRARVIKLNICAFEEPIIKSTPKAPTP